MQTAARQISCYAPAVTAVLAHRFADDSRTQGSCGKSRPVKHDRLSPQPCRNVIRCEGQKQDDETEFHDYAKMYRSKSLLGHKTLDLEDSGDSRRSEPEKKSKYDWIDRIKHTTHKTGDTLLGIDHFIYRVLCHHRRIEDDFEVTKELGHGGFGTVYLAQHKVLGYQRAVKTIKKSSAGDETTLAEVYALMGVDHPYITRLTRVYDSDTHFHLVLELCRGPDLLDFILDNNDIPEMTIGRIVRQMLKALQGCHSQYTVHSDVKPENFMFTFKDCMKLKMIDLGLCSTFKRSSEEYKGTIEFSAPEVSRGTSGPESDLWSCGVVLFLMATGMPLFSTFASDEMVEEQKRDRKFLKKRLQWASEQGLSDDCMDLLRGMLCFDRHMRITAQEALSHPFVVKSFQQEIHTHAETQEARRVLQSLDYSFGNFGKEPVLVRVALLLMAHLGGFMAEETKAMRHAFTMMDRNGMGELSMDAFETHLPVYDIDMPRHLEDAFHGVDLRGNGYVSYTTFIAATLPTHFRCQERLFKLVFELMDVYGDGRIHSKELEQKFIPDTEDGLEMCRQAVAEVSGKDWLTYDELFAALRHGHPSEERPLIIQDHT